jgi:hypothetical protein
MASGRKGKSKSEKRERKSGESPKEGTNRSRLRLIAHPLFAPGVGLWAAILGGMIIAVIPEAHIESLTASTLIATFDMPVKLMLAGVLALILGMAGFGIAAHRSAAARRRLNPYSIVNAVARKVSPIDPARDLGSKSIDDPIETMPFASPAWRDADIDAPGADDVAQEEEEEERLMPRFMRRRRPELEPDIEEAADAEPDFVPPAPAWREAALKTEEERPLPRFMSHPVPEAAPVPAPAPEAEHEDKPVELDLAAFAALPGRNAVWVEAPEAAPVPAPLAAPAPAPAPKPAPVAAPVAEVRRPVPTPPPLPGTAALARLRAVPAGELSIAQMVERFAGALHEHRANAPARALSAAELAAREAALAEALKALAVLSGVGAEQAAAPADREGPLRAALTQLQPRRGAA